MSFVFNLYSALSTLNCSFTCLFATVNTGSFRPRIIPLPQATERFGGRSHEDSSVTHGVSGKLSLVSCYISDRISTRVLFGPNSFHFTTAPSSGPSWNLPTCCFFLSFLHPALKGRLSLSSSWCKYHPGREAIPDRDCPLCRFPRSLHSFSLHCASLLLHSMCWNLEL